MKETQMLQMISLCIMCIIMFKWISTKLQAQQMMLRVIFEGVWPHFCRNTIEIFEFCRNTSPPKRGFFSKFSWRIYQQRPKNHFYCIFINKFPKNFEKSAQKFFAAPSAPKTCRNTPIFSALVCRNTPPPLRGHPPKNPSDLGTYWR